MKKIVLILGILATYTASAQTHLYIRSSDEKCATVSTLIRDNAFGNMGFWAARLTGGSKLIVLRSFLLFDLSSIPKGSFVNWARLSLYSVGGMFGPNEALLRRVTSPWDPATVTWNTQPSTALRGTIKLPMSTTNPEDYKNINVWTLVQAMVDSPETSFGFAIRLDSDAQGTANRSMHLESEASYSRDIPRLVIEYTAPGMKPAVTSMSLNGDGLPTQMTIYPNPSSTTFSCNLKSASQSDETIRVIDMLGRSVYSQPVNASNVQLQVNLPSGSAGTYFVILQDNKGATIVSQQLQVN